MRGYIEILEEIDRLLKHTAYESFTVEIEIPFRNYCSALEICYEVKAKMIQFENQDQSIRNLIGDQIDEFYRYCSDNGI